MKTTTKTFLWIAVAAICLLAGSYAVESINSIKSNIASKRSKAKIQKELASIKTDSTTIENIHNIILMDESGSMSSLRGTAIDGAAEVINLIKAASDSVKSVKQFLTLAFFDGSNGLRLEYVVDNQPVKDIQADLSIYTPTGMTPLYDAIGTVIMKHLEKIGPHDYTLMSIITDGYENDSRKYRASDIKTMVDTLSTKNWTFTYIGANQDAILEGGKMGINDSYNYDNTHDGYRQMMRQDTRRRIGRINGIANGRGRNNNE